MDVYGWAGRGGKGLGGGAEGKCCKVVRNHCCSWGKWSSMGMYGMKGGLGGGDSLYNPRQCSSGVLAGAVTTRDGREVNGKEQVSLEMPCMQKC